MLKEKVDLAEVVVIGGGIIGCSAAYFLSKEGFRVVLVERAEIASGASGSNQGGSPVYLHPPPVFDLALESVRMYRRLSEELQFDFEIDQSGLVIAALDKNQMPALEAHAKRTCGRHRMHTGDSMQCV